jgi:hypothetical protein
VRFTGGPRKGTITEAAKSNPTVTQSSAFRKPAVPSSAPSFSQPNFSHSLASEDKPTPTAEIIERTSVHCTATHAPCPSQTHTSPSSPSSPPSSSSGPRNGRRNRPCSQTSKIPRLTPALVASRQTRSSTLLSWEEAGPLLSRPSWSSADSHFLQEPRAAFSPLVSPRNPAYGCCWSNLGKGIVGCPR